MRKELVFVEGPLARWQGALRLEWTVVCRGALAT
jgi:hypothetical protein